METSAAYDAAGYDAVSQTDTRGKIVISLNHADMTERAKEPNGQTVNCTFDTLRKAINVSMPVNGNSKAGQSPTKEHGVQLIRCSVFPFSTKGYGDHLKFSLLLFHKRLQIIVCSY